MKFSDFTAPSVRRRVIEYGRDGNRVVRHWRNVQQIEGSLYCGAAETDSYGVSERSLYIFFGEESDGQCVDRIRNLERYQVADLIAYAKRMQFGSWETYLLMLQDRMQHGVWIGSVIIEFARQFDSDFADRLSEYRQKLLEERERKRREQMKEREEEERQKRQAEDEEKARYAAELHEDYNGWLDGMPAMKVGRIVKTMEELLRVDGQVMTRREFVKSCVRQGYRPEKSEGVTSWYGSKWEPRESKPKTEYTLRSPEERSFILLKTEYDFAVYLAEKEGI